MSQFLGKSHIGGFYRREIETFCTLFIKQVITKWTPAKLDKKERQNDNNQSFQMIPSTDAHD